MNKLLVICGPTATGKTNLAMSLARKYHGELVSADSRQIYKGMDIGTGKDIPPGFKIYDSEFMSKARYSDGEINTWGLDLVSPNSEFSVAHYYQYAREKIKEIWSRNKLPIQVGGTGLYIKVVLEGIDTAAVEPDIEIRAELEEKSVDDLYVILQNKNKQKAEHLNDSDKKNKRRLIRAIEIAAQPKTIVHQKRLEANILKIGLLLSREEVKIRIEKRIEKRLSEGFEAEVERLLLDGVSWSSQSMQSTGYRQYKSYLDGEISFEEFKKAWLQAELKYAKRQMTWFKKDHEVIWFAADRLQENLAETVQKWYSSTR